MITMSSLGFGKAAIILGGDMISNCLKLSRLTYPFFRSHSIEVSKDTLKGETEVASDLRPFVKTNTRHNSYLDELHPPMKRSFNLAAHINQSRTLQHLIKLGVSLYDIESTNSKAAQQYLHLDFEKDCVKYIRFLINVGVENENLGRFISQYPMIFMEHLDDLQTRINYLKSKGFSKRQIAEALNTSAIILSLPTKTVDYKLGLMQIEFNLPAPIIRTMIAKHPDLVMLPDGQFKLVNFALKEEFSFSHNEILSMLKGQPSLIEISRPDLISRLDLLHNIIGLSHATISRVPKLITGPQLDIKHRSLYLKKLGRDQYRPSKPLYVPPAALYDIDDEKFCALYAKTNLEDYKLFIKSC